MASKLLVTFSTARKPLPTTGPFVRSSTMASSASVMILLFSFLPSAVFDGSKASSSFSSPSCSDSFLSVFWPMSLNLPLETTSCSSLSFCLAASRIFSSTVSAVASR